MMYTNKYYGTQIGKTLGEVEDVEVDTDDTSWATYLRLRVKLNLFKAVARGQSLEVRGEKIWIPIRYEKLPRFCFNCGKMMHDSICNMGGDMQSKDQYGTWLRVKNQRKKDNFPSEQRKIYRP